MRGAEDLFPNAVPGWASGIASTPTRQSSLTQMLRVPAATAFGLGITILVLASFVVGIVTILNWFIRVVR